MPKLNVDEEIINNWNANQAKSERPDEENKIIDVFDLIYGINK